jgi:hypothetical protein
MSYVAAILVAAVLFAAFGLVKPRSCDGACTGCSNNCKDFKGEHHGR